MTRLDWVEDLTQFVWMFREHEHCLFKNENNVVLNGNIVEGKPCINRKTITLRSKFSYTVVMVNMKLLAVVTSPSIYRGKENLFLAVNMKNCGRRNVRKHKDIKGSDNYVTLDISLNFDSLDKMKIISSNTKEKLEISGKRLIAFLSFKAKVRPQKYKKSRYHWKCQ